MSLIAALLGLSVAYGIQGLIPQPRIHNIKVEGNFRVPSESILHQVSAFPGKPFDEASLRADLNRLHDTELFENVEISTRDAMNGQVDLIYRVREHPFLSSFEIQGGSRALADQINDLLRKEKLSPQIAAPFRPQTSNKMALRIRIMLCARGHPFPDVRVVADRQGSTVHAVLKVEPGPRLEVGEVRFSGNSAISGPDLIRQMKSIRPSSLLTRWSGAGRYSDENVRADLERLRRYYQSRGYAAASIGSSSVLAQEYRIRCLLPVPGMPAAKTKLEVTIPLVEGPQFQLAEAHVEGECGSAQNEVADIIAGIHAPHLYDATLLERTRDDIIRTLGRAGYAMARVELAQTIDRDHCLVHAAFKVEAGNPVLVGRIDFEGNLRLSDRFLRRELRLCEGEVYSSASLDESIRRLNRTGLIEELSRSDVFLNVDEERKLVDIVFKLKEQKQRGVHATGGTGGPAGGYLGIIYSAFNLLGLGEKLSLELDGGASQANLLLTLAGTHFLGSPFTLALAGMHRVTNLNIAGLVPNQKDVIGIFRSHQTGAGLAGSYPLTTKAQLGLGFQIGRESIERAATGTGMAPGASASTRIDLSPSFLFDTTGGVGRQPRGYRVAFGHTWSGTDLLRTIDSTREWASFQAYRSDPFSHGRNAFAFRLQGVTALPLGMRSLALERRLFPGDELVRGFRRGELSAWSYDATSTTTSSLQPAGADSAIGFSAEYRVPLSGPLSGAAFLDLGWTRLSTKSAGATFIEAQTNRLLRMSTGGELRFHMPGIRQPARFIFAWNPLRLENLIGGTTHQRLADPEKSIRLALGNLF